MVKEAKKPTAPSKALLPAMGLISALAFAVLAYFLAPYVVDLIAKQVGEQEFYNRLGSTSRTTFEYAIAVMLWLVIFSTAMFFVAALIGEDPAKEEQLVKPAPGASAKELKAYYKKLEKIEDRRMKRAEQLKKQQERANRK